jgi:diaminopimelate epimerase
MKLVKAHGYGNDFILIAAADAPAEPSPWVRRLCDRHKGVGGDGVILHSKVPGGVSLQLWNADGGLVELSGNGTRCLAALAVREGWAPPKHTVFTVSGPRPVEVTALGGSLYRVLTDLGPAILASDEVPVVLEPRQPRVVDHPIAVGDETVRVTATSLGNPHCAVFVDAPLGEARFSALGPALERHPFFPKGTNVEFVRVVARGEIRVQFWERGVGYTQSSGTGSASAAVAAIVKGLVDRELRVVCDGGTLEVSWPEGGHVRQIGEAEILFDAEWRPTSRS